MILWYLSIYLLWSIHTSLVSPFSILPAFTLLQHHPPSLFHYFLSLHHNLPPSLTTSLPPQNLSPSLPQPLSLPHNLSPSLPPPQIKKQQQKIDMTLTSKKIEFEKVDVAASEDAKKKMREIAGNPTALPPQLCNGDQYCGVSSVCVYCLRF